MTVFANFVRCTLQASISAGSTSFDVLHESPYRAPPAPLGSIGRMILTDSLRTPTAFEIITYTGTAVVDPNRTTLTGVTRGTQGTSARPWNAGDFAQHDVTAADLGLLGLQNPPALVISGGLDNSVRVHEKGGQEIRVQSEHDQRLVAVSINAHGEVASLDADGGLKKFNADGSVAWEVDIGTTVGGQRADVKISESGRVYYIMAFQGNGTGERRVQCRDSADGSEVWAFVPTGEPNGCDVDASDNFFYCESSAGLVMVDPDGNRVWESDPGFTLGGFAVSVAPDQKKIAVGSSDEIHIMDYGGQELDSFAEFDIPQKVVFLSGDLLVIAVASGDLRHCSTDGTDKWRLETVVETFSWMTMDATDLGYVAYVSRSNPNRVWTYDLNGDLIGTFNDHLSPVRAIAVPRIANSHCIVYDNGFKLARLSYDDLADKPSSFDQVSLSTSVVPETPPTGKAYLYFEGTNLVVKWDDGTTDTIATKGP